MTAIRAALADGERRLAGGESPRLDAEVLLAHVLGKSRAHLYTWPDAELGAAQLEAFLALVERRAAGEPVAYLCGRRAFWSLELRVTPSVLIPRPETELLVELALALLPAGPQQVADLGTGSGAIALALAAERPAWRIIATDASPAALGVAEDNAGRLALENLEFRLGDWCAPLENATFDAIVANPPYISAEDPHLARGDVRFEPRDALISAGAGLADLRRIASEARGRLRAGGRLLMEHGFAQGAPVRDLLGELGYRDIATHRDLAGHERVTSARTGQEAGPSARKS